jgi:myosin-5
MARKRFHETLDNYKATEIQRFCRGYLARKAYREKLKNIVIVQASVRKFLAKRLYKKMKVFSPTFLFKF